MKENQPTQPAHAAYGIQTVTDMLKVPADRRSAMLRELETALLTHEPAAIGSGAASARPTPDSKPPPAEHIGRFTA